MQTDENMEKTRLQNLIRHKPKRYYARAFAGGKEVWKSLNTSHFSASQARGICKRASRARPQWQRGLSVKIEAGQAALIHLRNLRRRG